MTLKNRGVCNVANVCWQRVPDGRTSHRKCPRTWWQSVELYDDVSDDVSVEERIKDAVYSKLQPESMRWNPNMLDLLAV